MAKILDRLKNMVKKNDASMAHPIVIVDVGCRWGFADKFIDHIDHLKVYGFDPDEEECKRLENLYQNDHIKLIPVGLSDTLGSKKLHITQEPACSSLFPPNKRLTTEYPALACAREVSQVQVQLTTLDQWVEDEGVDYIDYMKIDTQGAELSILKGGQNILESVRFIEVEVEFNPIYDGQPTFSEVDLFLRSKGFSLWKLSNIVHYAKGKESEMILGKDSINYDEHRLEYEVRGGQIYWADAFYIRNEIINVDYSSETIGFLEGDKFIAGILGFEDLKSRLEQELKQ